MNDIQFLIDRQIGFYNRLSYDNILRRLVVNNGESFYGLQNSGVVANLDEDPPIFACRFAETSGYEHILALANEDGRVGLQNTFKSSDANTVEGFQCHNNAVFDLAWMPQAMKFVTVSGDHTAHLWAVDNGTPQKLQVFSAHTRSVKTVAFRPQQASAFATGGRDGHILLWDERVSSRPTLRLNPEDRLLRCHSCPSRASPAQKRMRPDDYRATSITGLVFQDDNTLISCGECDGNIKVWDLRKNYNIYKREPLPKHSIPYCGSSTKNGYTNLIIDQAALRLYASCMDNVIYCYNISTYNTLPEQRYIGHENNTFYIKTCLSPDCNYLVSGSSDKNAYLWNVKCSQPVVKLTGHWAEVTCAAWCQVGDTKVVTCSDDARHKIWKIGKEFYSKEEELSLKGSAEIVPRTDVTNLPQWGALERSPNVSKRRINTPGSSTANKRSRLDLTGKKSKRCLMDMMNASKDEEISSKRIKSELPSMAKLEETLLSPGVKRSAEEMFSSPSKRTCPNNKENSWYSPKAGSSFMTPTKNYEKSSPKLLSPNKSVPKLLSFTTPTKNLPDFVVSGEAPHLRLMSPMKKKETRNWLTEMCKDKRFPPPPACPKEALQSKRLPPTPPRLPSQSNTLLMYFNKDK